MDLYMSSDICVCLRAASLSTQLLTGSVWSNQADIVV